LKAWVLLGVGFSLVLASGIAAAAPRFSEWSVPINLGPMINSAANDLGPAISGDGRSLYFGSNRPGGYGQADLWVSQRASVDDPWGSPLNLGATINTASSEQVPALSRDGHWLFFAGNRPGGFGGTDLWASWREQVHDDFGWQAPVNLGAGVNSASFDAGASYFENDDGGVPLLFFNSDRPGGPGGIDIYVSAQQPDGSFGPAELVEELSSAGNDQRPAVRFDGLELFLWSDRSGSLGATDLWVFTRDQVSDAWGTPVNLGTTVNGVSTEAQPYIGSDRMTLFFSSDRPGGAGGFDLYMTTRSK
jgi:Tol biopolymer transport system component